jgi:hypothetical protein
MIPVQSGFRSHEYLVLGGSGAVGRFLLRRLHERGADVTAISREPPPHWAAGWPSVHWHRGALERLDAPASAAPLQLIGAGPLDALAEWLGRVQLPSNSRVVALSSMSLEWKVNSPNPAERALAARLQTAEQALSMHCGRQGLTLVLLRPTLIYGAGIDRSLSPLLRFARRWRCLPWPRRAIGLRQPVHADDVAAALLAALRIALPEAPLALPGAEPLRFDAMVDRMLTNLSPGCRRIALPVPLPRAMLRRVATGSGRAAAAAAVLWRSSQDQVADQQGWKTLGLQPRGFDPAPPDFAAW